MCLVNPLNVPKCTQFIILLCLTVYNFTLSNAKSLCFTMSNAKQFYLLSESQFINIINIVK